MLKYIPVDGCTLNFKMINHPFTEIAIPLYMHYSNVLALENIYDCCSCSLKPVFTLTLREGTLHWCSQILQPLYMPLK